MIYYREKCRCQGESGLCARCYYRWRRALRRESILARKAN